MSTAPRTRGHHPPPVRLPPPGLPAVWAPRAGVVELVVDGMPAARTRTGADGWCRFDVELAPGTSYAFALDGGEPLPDPRSRWQPDGVLGPSRVVDPDGHRWRDATWHGCHLPSSVVYELHVGTFTPEGTFDAAVDRLDHLVALGVDVVEVMPVAEFPGRFGWGYDGVALWSVRDAYGGPDGFKRLVDAAHERGIGVVLDVVYNHLGPEGNVLGRFGPYFTDRHHTPWGDAVNLDADGSPEVRAFVLGSAIAYLADYHLDGLRLDATHALVDDSAVHLLEELSVAVARLSAHVGRPLWLIAENDRNDARLVTSREAGGLGMDAVWADDLHHALHSLLTGERRGYYADYGDLAHLAAALERPFVYDGRWSPARGRPHGRPAGHVPRCRFVVCDQNHDQVGNRASGERLHHLAGIAAAKLAAAVVLTAPGTPMLFMGEEFAASAPFCFMADFEAAELRDAVRNGRIGEFEAFGWAEEDIADPIDPATFERSKLDWSEVARGEHADVLGWYRTLIGLRRAFPELTDPEPGAPAVRFDAEAGWLRSTRGQVVLVVNVGAQPVRIDVRDGTGVDPHDTVTSGGAPAVVLAASAAGVTLVAGSVHLPPCTAAVVGSEPVGAGASIPLAPGEPVRPEVVR